MEFISTQKYIVMSPKKLRLVLGMVKKLTPQKAVEILPYVGKRAYLPIQKVLLTAMADAKVKNIDAGDLLIKEIQINEGPRLKRGNPVSRGRWHPYVKRMSSIRVVLEKKKETPSLKEKEVIKKGDKNGSKS